METVHAVVVREVRPFHVVTIFRVFNAVLQHLGAIDQAYVLFASVFDF